MKKIYINKPYKGSIPFNAVEYCTGLDQLIYSLPFAKDAVVYWEIRKKQIQINFFKDHHIEHINELKRRKI